MIHAMPLRAPSLKRRPAVFIDRDGTLTEYSGFITQPGGLSLIDGVWDAVDRFAGSFACVVVTNQSAAGRGLISERQLDAIHERLDELLQCDDGTPLIEAIYQPVEKPGQETR